LPLPSGIWVILDQDRLLLPCSIFGFEEVKGGCWTDDESTGRAAAATPLSVFVSSSNASPFQSVHSTSSSGGTGISQRDAALSHRIALINSFVSFSIVAAEIAVKHSCVHEVSRPSTHDLLTYSGSITYTSNKYPTEKKTTKSGLLTQDLNSNSNTHYPHNPPTHSGRVSHHFKCLIQQETNCKNTPEFSSSSSWHACRGCDEV
jgi:hypothetical protein